MKHGKTRISSQTETDFNFGYFYRTIEEHIDRFAAQAGASFTVADIADRLGQLLRVKAQNVRTQSRAAELLQQMQQDSKTAGKRTRGSDRGETRQTLPGGSSARRTLSPEARLRIAEAQRKRWKKQKREKKTKRRYTAKGLAALRENIKKAQAARWAKAA